MTQRITLNGSVHKDLSKIVKAVSTIRSISPDSQVSVLIESEDKNGNQQLSPKNNPSESIQADTSQNRTSTSNSQTPNLFIAGTGTVGGELLRQLYELRKPDFKPLIAGICNSKKVLWNYSGLTEVEAQFLNTHSEASETDWVSIIDELIERKNTQTIFIDATGSKQVSEQYERLLESGIHVVTPSKLANTESQKRFDYLSEFEKKGVYFRYEATAGAGLPVIQTIKNLVKTGDSITKISGVISGTMTYIFDALENGIAFSQAVKAAALKGYAEPDPRDDLSGEDVARKFMILARVAGYTVERTDFETENQTPDLLREVDLSTFFEQLPAFDDLWRKRIADAKSKGNVLRYVGEVNEGRIAIGVRSVPKSSPLGTLRGTDNQISIFSSYYSQSPIIIQGPGAGKEVTAQALLNDIRQICYLIQKN